MFYSYGLRVDMLKRRNSVVLTIREPGPAISAENIIIDIRHAALIAEERLRWVTHRTSHPNQTFPLYFGHTITESYVGQEVYFRAPQKKAGLN